MPNNVANLTRQDFAALSNTSIIPPPTGVESNFANATIHNLPLLIVSSILLAVMGVFVLNRVYAKKFLVKRYSRDNCKPYAILQY